MGLLDTRLALGQDLGYTTLNGAITDSDTTLIVTSGAPFDELSASTNRRRYIPAVIVDAASPSAVTFGDLQSGEHIAIVEHVTAASTTIEVLRGASPSAHADGELIMIMPTAQVWDSVYDRMAFLESALVASMGGGSGAGVLNYGAVDKASFDCNETGTPDLNVTLQVGICWYDSSLQQLSAASVQGAFVAPTTSTRTDVICAFPDDDSIVIVAGTEGAGAPSIPTGYVPLWNVTLRVGSGSIKEVDDATNGYLTDVRSFA